MRCAVCGCRGTRFWPCSETSVDPWLLERLDHAAGMVAEATVLAIVRGGADALSTTTGSCLDGRRRCDGLASAGRRDAQPGRVIRQSGRVWIAKEAVIKVALMVAVAVIWFWTQASIPITIPDWLRGRFASVFVGPVRAKAAGLSAMARATSTGDEATWVCRDVGGLGRDRDAAGAAGHAR